MTDLTDSFCERCGARYAFVASGPKGLSLKGARVLARGLKNFVFTDGQSISDAMELARHEDDHEASTRVAEAFHRTFNFCMSCRQYACDRCWNETAGECLSCAPTPEAEWSLFAETPPADPYQDAAANTLFQEPVISGGRRPERPPRRRPDAVAWPAADLAEVRQAKPAGSHGKKGHDSAKKAADRDAAKAWPAADEISPEMTLTDEELEIVHANLSQSRSKDVPAAAAAAAAAETPAASEAPLLQEPRAWWNSRAADEDANRSVDWALDEAATEDVPATDSALAAATAPIDGTQAEWVAEPSTSELDLPPVSSKLLRRTSTTDDLPPLTPSEPETETPESSGLVARLFGKRAPESEPSPAAGPPRASSKRGHPAESWPRPTAWLERSLEGRHWWVAADAATAGPAPMTADGAFPPELVDAAPVAMPEEPAAVRSPDRRRTGSPKPRHAPAARPSRTAPVPPAAGPVDIDPRSAAALRLSSLEATMPLPAASEVEPDTAELRHDAPAAPAHEPAWLRVQREAAEPEPDRSIDVPDNAPAADAADTPATEELVAAAPMAEEPKEQAQATFDMPVQPPATPWPPLGASWPAREKPGAPWPAPDAADVPAVVAAGQVPTQTMAEMWAQSAQEVLNRGSVRVCHHCALPVSTKARFCRRCGTQQV